MSLLIKVSGNEGIMDVHKKSADKNGCTWYSYQGGTRTKPYNEGGLTDVYFIESNELYHAELLKIHKCPRHGGVPLDSNEYNHIPSKYLNYITTNWDKFAFSLKCKNIIHMEYNLIKDIYFERTGNPTYNSKTQSAVTYVYLKKQKIEYIYPTKKLVEEAFIELGKTKASRTELINKLKEIVEHGGCKLLDDNEAWKEIQNLSDELFY